MELKQLVYSSQPFGYDESILSGILLDARRNNARDGVSGALICRRDIYLQMLEGPERQVDDVFRRIGQDDRHIDVALHVAAPIRERMFGAWDMLHDPARSWLWSEDDLHAGALKRASAAEITDVFAQLARKVA